MKINKKISLALLAVTLFGADSTLAESQINSGSNIVQAAKKKPKKSKKAKSKKSKKSKKTMSISKIYKRLFGKKSGNKTIEKYRNKIVKVAQKFVKKNGKLDADSIKYQFYLKKTTKNAKVYSEESYEDDQGMESGYYLEVDDYPYGDNPQYLIDEDDGTSLIDVVKYDGKYYYLIENQIYYPVNQYKPAIKKF